MENWQVELIQRITRIEENQNFIKESIKDLPQSPHCVAEFKRIDERVDEIEDVLSKVHTKMTYAGGVLVAFGMLIPYLMPWIINRLST